MRSFAILLLAASVVACGGEGPDPEDSTGVTASFELSCDVVECANADDSFFSFDSGFCQWNCATYENETERFVVIDFFRAAGCWAVRTSTVGVGSCLDLAPSP